MPTFCGWVVLIAGFLLVSFIAVRSIYGFLAPSVSMDGGALVVEGWGDDRMMSRAIDEYGRHHYESLYVTGGPIPRGSLFSEFQSMAEFSAKVIDRLSGGRILAQPVSAPEVQKDRTFTSALETKKWMQAHGGIPRRVTVLSLGPHSRRTWLLYRKAFGPSAEVGIIAAEPEDYEPARWWASSNGFRAVVGEAIAYGYARVIFWKSGG